MNVYLPTRQNWCTPENAPTLAKSSTVDVTGQRRGVAEDRVVADVAVVRDVRVGHQQVAVADAGQPAAARRAAMDGHELADDVARRRSRTRVGSPPNFRSCGTRPIDVIGKIWLPSPISVTPSITHDAPILQSRPIVTRSPMVDERTDDRPGADLRAGMHDRRRMDLARARLVAEPIRPR